MDKSKSEIIEIDGIKIIACKKDGKPLPESDIQALREFVAYRKNRNKKSK